MLWDVAYDTDPKLKPGDEVHILSKSVGKDLGMIALESGIIGTIVDALNWDEARSWLRRNRIDYEGEPLAMYHIAFALEDDPRGGTWLFTEADVELYT